MYRWFLCLNQAADIKKEAQRLMQENAKLLNDTINQRSEAEGLLDSGIKNQQVWMDRHTLSPLSLSDICI